MTDDVRDTDPAALAIIADALSRVHECPETYGDMPDVSEMPETLPAGTFWKFWSANGRWYRGVFHGVARRQSSGPNNYLYSDGMTLNTVHMSHICWESVLKEPKR